ncbi:MAG: TIGR03557 family F420-dependent LLM class oxidoreductase [Frankia sp.]|nr:TIGR03557 family F420-dependent LLM class oxidoreductase [Frankia sp.]
MVAVGCALSSEEHAPRELVRLAQRAEELGFEFLGVSDHFHPWVSKQGQSPFVWSVLGGIAATTTRITVGTGVTCPTVRIHPAIVAQAAATTAAMLPGRFVFGVGTGEALNEHVLGDRWPSVEIRREMLAEALDVIRKLWTGELVSHRGRHYEVENARLFTVPDEPPPVVVAASAKGSAQLAARIGDGFWSTAPDKDLLATYADAGGSGARIGQATVCWAATDAEARRTAYEWWPNGGLKGPLSTELKLPEHFDAAVEMVSEEDVAASVKCGADPMLHRAAVQEFVDAGYDTVYVHQVGPQQDAFLDFYAREVLPHFR